MKKMTYKKILTIGKTYLREQLKDKPDSASDDLTKIRYEYTHVYLAVEQALHEVGEKLEDLISIATSKPELFITNVKDKTYFKYPCAAAVLYSVLKDTLEKELQDYIYQFLVHKEIKSP